MSRKLCSWWQRQKRNWIRLKDFLDHYLGNYCSWYHKFVLGWQFHESRVCILRHLLKLYFSAKSLNLILKDPKVTLIYS
jgi:hypothetical protein